MGREAQDRTVAVLGVAHGDLVGVEVAVAGDQVAVRDSKDQAGPVLLFSTDEWRAFAAGMRDGEFEIA